MRRSILTATPLAAASAVALMLASGGPAVAASTTSAARASVPIHGSFSDYSVTYQDTDVCAAEGLAVDVIHNEVDDYTVFRDANGDFDGAIVHVDYKDVISANGHTITERDKWQDFYGADGSLRKAGLTAHLQGPGGIVQLDAGQIVYNPDGSVAYTHGRHPQLEGQTFCFALVP